MKIKLLLVSIVMMMVLLAGCGGPKPDVPIFAMGPNGFPSDVGEKLQTSLTAKIGQAPTIQVVAVPIFSMEKMIVELAAAGNGIFILGDEQFQLLAKQAGFVQLDDIVSPEDYPGGVLGIAEEEGKPAEKHLYGIPLEGNKWLKEQGMDGKGLVAFIPQNFKKVDEAKQVMKILAEK
ncbi:hypothetical protein [Paenibacillus hexagrammi]|uniref:Lipoprotein n=1 Tax=Paenibacillus hexagrammi TaxID=2908839 RepID=A0ABY3SM28_9BACL|nr:hypothetical protein [Paenibacillus sp. YPD9-1]UJF34470.1 hypothetical protein L0M14_04575 [Paenibacillus sp. YPD9-1]